MCIKICSREKIAFSLFEKFSFDNFFYLIIIKYSEIVDFIIFKYTEIYFLNIIIIGLILLFIIY